MIRTWVSLGTLLLLVGCAGGGGSYERSSAGVATPATSTASGRYSMDRDAYPDLPPDVSNVPDAVPRVEPLSRGGNRPTYEVWGKTYHVLPDAAGYQNQGIASWYGEKFHGYSTANGEIYDMYKMTAAHRSLPLPSFARVTSVDTGRSVIVRVNDRGPFHEDREIDLSYAAASRLDILGNGTGRVRVEAIDPVAWQNGQQGASTTQLASNAASGDQGGRREGGHSTNGQVAVSAPSASSGASASNGAAGHVYLQVAALGSSSNAEALKAQLQSELSQPVRVTSDAAIHRVQVGPVRDASHLEPLRDELRRAGFTQTVVVNDNP
ncbi:MULTISPECIES: septal ring lytic transglycosylase RlpA family protein [Halomonadaceae]|uniref:septal ring lytic transglycosylase RlpA family protein n=1 Tax=Halomonadaceae TaxID=28256 RepID=UPI0015973C98|nr:MULTISPECIES: septal ring lytic transglycosylase RlpA family protein [Halomonas]QJQ94101.1 septal ring lytic transglycosylase RlpA family protein [Halomonas sp. PA5]